MRPILRALCVVAPLAASAGCASLPVEAAQPGERRDLRVALMTPRDGVPVRARDALPDTVEPDDMEGARSAALATLRGDFATALRERGLEVVEVAADGEMAGKRKPDPAEIARRGRAAGAGAAIDVELLAYGDIRRSWLWALGAQALLAGLGHGLAVVAATGDSTLAWQVGGAEFLLETVTWVGGALVGGRVIDPVILRVRLVDAASGAPIHRWTREGTRPWSNWKRWFHRQPLPPRAERLRAVADGVLSRLAPKIVKALAKAAPPGGGSGSSVVGQNLARRPDAARQLEP